LHGHPAGALPCLSRAANPTARAVPISVPPPSNPRQRGENPQVVNRSERSGEQRHQFSNQKTATGTDAGPAAGTAVAASPPTRTSPAPRSSTATPSTRSTSMCSASRNGPSARSARRRHAVRCGGWCEAHDARGVAPRRRHRGRGLRAPPASVCSPHCARPESAGRHSVQVEIVTLLAPHPPRRTGSHRARPDGGGDGEGVRGEGDYGPCSARQKALARTVRRSTLLTLGSLGLVTAIIEDSQELRI